MIFGASICQSQQSFLCHFFCISCSVGSAIDTFVLIKHGQSGFDKALVVFWKPRSFRFVENLQFGPDNSVANLQPLLLLA